MIKDISNKLLMFLLVVYILLAGIYLGKWYFKNIEELEKNQAPTTGHYSVGLKEKEVHNER